MGKVQAKVLAGVLVGLLAAAIVLTVDQIFTDSRGRSRRQSARDHRAENLRLAPVSDRTAGNGPERYRPHRNRRVLPSKSSAECRPVALAAGHPCGTARLSRASAGQGHRIRRQLRRSGHQAGLRFRRVGHDGRGVRSGAHQVGRIRWKPDPARRCDVRSRRRQECSVRGSGIHAAWPRHHRAARGLSPVSSASRRRLRARAQPVR